MTSLSMPPSHPSPAISYNFIFAGVCACVVLVLIAWERRYRRQWQAFRARNWRRVIGKFDEGEIITMLKGRSKEIAGYKVLLMYDYEAEGKQCGDYWSEEMTQQQAEFILGRLANRSVTVRVSPDDTAKSIVLDEDLADD